MKPASSTSSPLRRMRSFLISVRSIRRVESFSFSPDFMAALTSASMRCCGGVVVMGGIIGGVGLRCFLIRDYHFSVMKRDTRQRQAIRRAIEEVDRSEE